ncbi:MAG: UDP-glucose 4-epimerase GalE [Holosporaceae bacterium]|jgi:UDP-glucose 4-epimerase|nr:UDP-glucose 4-epimerase GalE [Holosporaceae bacterium]
MILVTGGAGYIGSHAVVALLEEGFDVVIFDSLENGYIETVNALKTIEARGRIKGFIRGDLQNLRDVYSIFSRYKIEAVIHFAAYISVEESMKDPMKYYYNNLLGSLNLISAMLDYGIDKIVYSSTAAVYGSPNRVPIDEECPTSPINPYGQSKKMVEQILDDCDKAFGLRNVRLRYFNVAGADGLLRVGERHEPETHLIPNLIASACDSQETFNLYGDKYKTRDGTCIRDYVNVEDLADAHVLALKYLLDGGNSDYFNLGTSDGSSVKEVLAVCEQTIGKKIKTRLCEPRVGDPETLVADNKKAAKILGWKPKRSLEDSVRTAYEWHKKEKLA